MLMMGFYMKCVELVFYTSHACFLKYLCAKEMFNVFLSMQVWFCINDALCDLWACKCYDVLCYEHACEYGKII